MEQLQTDTVIVVQHVLAVALGGIGARPLMQYGIDVAELALRHTLAKVVFMHVVGNLRAHQIDELVAVGKIVDHQNIAVSGAVQPTHQVAADKTRTARHHNPNSSSAVTTDVRSEEHTSELPSLMRN